MGLKLARAAAILAAVFVLQLAVRFEIAMLQTPPGQWFRVGYLPGL